MIEKFCSYITRVVFWLVSMVVGLGIIVSLVDWASDVIGVSGVFISTAVSFICAFNCNEFITVEYNGKGKQS